MDLNLFPKITVILRGFNYKQTRDIVNILSKSKINSVEIPLGQEDSKAIINKIIEEFGEEMVVGAGTVLKEEDLRDVINIGVKFALSPVMFTDKMIDICKAHNVISVPGAYSPTEIYTSYEKGADIIKVFPADIVTPKFFKGVKAPLKDLKLMAVGGVNEKNAEEFFKNGSDYLGIGSGIMNKEEAQKGDFTTLINNIKLLEKSL